MTRNLVEILITKQPGILGAWRLEAFGAGFPRPDVPFRVAFRWTKRQALALARLWQDPTQPPDIYIGGPSEVIEYGRKRNGRGGILDRSTAPRSADPRGKG